MKNTFINFAAALIIGIGSFLLIQPKEAYAMSGECPYALTLECVADGDTFVCCGVCQQTGEITSCSTHPIQN